MLPIANRRAFVRELTRIISFSERYGSPGSVLYFRVDDIDQAHAQFSGRGVAFLDKPHLIARMPDHELWMSLFKDSEGNTLALMAEKR